MRLKVNGEPQEVPEGTRVMGLLALLQVTPERVAVEVNLEIVPRARYDLVALKENDLVEIIGFIGGGGSDAR